jgi:uncharacterized protein
MSENNSPRILFLCVANSARSQIAEGLAKLLFGNEVRVASAGSRPSGAIHPMAVEVMHEVGIDLSTHLSKSYSSIGANFMDGLDYVITLCAEEECPIIFSGAEKINWGLPDPAGTSGADQHDAFISIRDELKKRLLSFGLEKGFLPAGKSILRQKALEFLDHILSQIRRLKLPMRDHWSIDHLCYRVETLAEYDSVKQEFFALGDLLIESEVNGRLISTFKLFEPIEYEGNHISVVELPAPKKGKPTKTGFEHIEIVCDLSFDELKSALTGLSLDESGLKKPFNKELEVLLGDFAVKYHHISLASVIRLERNALVFQALKESRALEVLSQFNPLVAGTFPLGLDVDGSDLDILLESKNLDMVDKTISEAFGQQISFKTSRVTVEGVQTLIASFEFANVSFELFAQPIPTQKQTAYRHFQIEERILDLGSDRLTHTITALRTQGLKTEPAIAKALRLSGDPFGALLNLHGVSHMALASFIATAE